MKEAKFLLILDPTAVPFSFTADVPVILYTVDALSDEKTAMMDESVSFATDLIFPAPSSSGILFSLVPSKI